jgi:1-acyl-sn-glycerol-3-phosphate acyltransferase
MLRSPGPLLLAVNHPNSYLDAIILDSLFKQPVYSLARGDVFKNKNIARILRALKILPVYREREGTEHLHKNYHTFDACLDIFKKNGTVLIFTEALSENEWHLRPLKKGTARLAAAAWEEGIPLKILPVGVNYSSFRLFGKNVHINFGSFIEQNNVVFTESEYGKLLNAVTNSIEQQLRQLVYEIDDADKQQQAKIFSVPVSKTKKVILLIPAAIGAILHFPFYVTLQKTIGKKMLNTGHYDSVMISSIFLLYPVYLLLLVILTRYLTSDFWWLIILLAPFTAWSYVQLQQQTDK